jgi:hypothetical protein
MTILGTNLAIFLCALEHCEYLYISPKKLSLYTSIDHTSIQYKLVHKNVIVAVAGQKNQSGVKSGVFSQNNYQNIENCPM